MKKEEKYFLQGCACVLGWIARERGCADVAMKELGITLDVLEEAGCDEYDTEVIRPKQEAEHE